MQVTVGIHKHAAGEDHYVFDYLAGTEDVIRAIHARGSNYSDQDIIETVLVNVLPDNRKREYTVIGIQDGKPVQYRTPAAGSEIAVSLARDYLSGIEVAGVFAARLINLLTIPE